MALHALAKGTAIPLMNDRRILIVEDDPDLRRALGHLLKSGKEPTFSVIEASTGVEGLATCCSAQPDCVLLDYVLPDMDGLAFLTELTGDGGIPPFPVVVLTGKGNPEIDREAIRRGAQDYLEKGTIDSTLLKRAVRRALERHQRLRQQVEERRRVEEELHALNESMELHMAERAAALRESEARVRAILNTAAEGIVTFDEQGVIQSFNRAAEPLFGYAAEEMLGTNIDSLVPGLRNPVGDTQGTRIGRRSDGSLFPVEVTLSQLPLGQQRLSIAIIRDVTEQKRAEEARQLFLAVTSHDVRNALAVIAGYASALGDGLPDDQQKKALSRITSLAQTLSTIMANIVVHAGLTREDEVFYRPVSIRDLLIDLAKDIEERCRQKGVALTVHPPEDVTIVIDKPKLTRILQNLLVNAVRYTNEGSIEVRGEVTDDELRVSVRDTGIGIEPAAMPHIFEPYYRHEAAREIEPLGTGLGLATVKKLCEVLGGAVSVDSTPGRGTTFTVTVPRMDKSPEC